MRELEKYVMSHSTIGRMPRSRHKHRNKFQAFNHPPFNACVARPVGKKEVAKEPAARETLDKERKRLRDIKTWDESRAEEWQDMAKRC